MFLMNCSTVLLFALFSRKLSFICIVSCMCLFSLAAILIGSKLSEPLSLAVVGIAVYLFLFLSGSQMALPGPSAQPRQEYVIRVPKTSEKKRFSVIKFNGNLKVDTAAWKDDGQVILDREDNQKTILSSAVTQDFGEGSEYGRAAREEARRKKYGRQLKTYQLDKQPWQLSFMEEDGRERKFRSLREGGAGEHADYWVFQKVGDEFHAYKVDDWHQFLPAITHKVLDADQAEEQFLLRSRVMNQFALKAQIQKQLNTMDDGEELEKPKGLKIKDDFSDTDGEESGEEKDEEKEKKIKKKKKKTAVEDEKKRDKRVRVKDADEVARYESEDGEDEGREYDYMTDSGSDSDRDNETMEQKVEKAMVGVGDEEGLKKMMDSDDEDEEEDEDPTKKLLNRDENEKKKNMDIEERDSSGSDTDDPDQEKVDSVVFMQKKAEAAANKKRALEDAAAAANPDAKKHKGDDGKASSSSVPVASAEPEGINEQTVRKYLERKPHTTKELVARIKSKYCANMEKTEIVAKLAQVLKKIGPHQFKQKVGKKEVLFFSLQNNMA